MSIKTMKQRIALVAVSAMGFGLLSIAPASANYALGEFNFATQSSVINGGVCTSTNTDAYGTTVATAVNGSLVSLTGDGMTDADTVYISVTGPAVIQSYTVAAGTTSGATVTSNTVTEASGLDNDVLNLRLTGLGKVYVALGVSSTTAALDVITITSVAACTSSTYSATYSQYETSIATDSTPGATDGFEAESTYTYVDADIAYVSIVGENGYDAVLPVGVWTATTSTGCKLDLATASPASTGLSSTTDSIIAAGTNIYASVEQGTTGTALSCTVGITYNGVSVYSKTILFTGDLASITVSGVDVQATGGATLTGIYDIAAKDAAGNQISVTVAGDSSKYTTQVTSVTGGTTSASSSTMAAATWTCAATSGKSSVRVVATNNAGDPVYSNAFDALCGAAAYTYTAGLDKASYVPGDIATLTITAKDSKGFAPFKGETVDAAAGAPSIAGSQLTAVNTPVAADVFDANGVKTYVYTVGSTAGKYNMAVNLGYAGNAAVSVAYSVASSGEVSNADVLKSIVALIASINKQIQALQKLILARR